MKIQQTLRYPQKCKYVGVKNHLWNSVFKILGHTDLTKLIETLESASQRTHKYRVRNTHYKFRAKYYVNAYERILHAYNMTLIHLDKCNVRLN